jgi:PAS domain S-box-containing protein
MQVTPGPMTPHPAAGQHGFALSGETLRSVLDAVPWGVLLFDPTRHIVFANQYAESFLGESAMAARELPRVFDLLIDPTTGHRILEDHPLDRALRGDFVDFSEYLTIRDSGTHSQWLTLSARPVRGPDSGIQHVVFAFRDIGVRKRNEENLRETEERFSTFMANLPGIAFIKDLDGRYVYHNDSVLDGNYRSDEITGHTDEELWPGEDADRYRQSDRRVIETGKPAQSTERRMQPDGMHSWLIYKFPIFDDKRVAFTGGIGVDITERTILEDQLTQARKIEALGRLASGVAHDFNNLLTVISGYGHLALETIGSGRHEKLSSYVQEILNSARRASGLTGQLLAFSRSNETKVKALDLAELLRNTQLLLERVIGEDVELTVRTPSEPCFIQADPHLVEQAVMNLAVNARDAMPLGGTLEIVCRRLPSPIERPGGEPPLEILLEVRDTGIGMDEPTRKKIFDPFFTSKEKGKGTGLGLSTVHGVVSHAGGMVEVESAPGEGAAFFLYFPVARVVEPKTAISGAVQPQRAAARETVLLVEDEPSVRSLAETILSRQGYQVIAAESGIEALRIWKERAREIDIVLTDVIMPQMSGGELARQLRELNPRLRILFMSGYADDIIASYGVSAGEIQLLQKPFTPEALTRKLRDVLDA